MLHANRHQHTLKSLDKTAPAKTWAEQWDDLKAMWNAGVPTEEIAENLGRTVSAVLTQAARLQLARRTAPGRKARDAAAQNPGRQAKNQATNNVIAFHLRGETAAVETVQPRHAKKDRNCLMCSTSFTSIGSHNRICPRCKAGSAYQVGHDEAFRILSA